jgi:hypothetical protein
MSPLAPKCYKSIMLRYRPSARNALINATPPFVCRGGCCESSRDQNLGSRVLATGQVGLEGDGTVKDNVRSPTRFSRGRKALVFYLFRLRACGPLRNFLGLRWNPRGDATFKRRLGRNWRTTRHAMHSMLTPILRQSAPGYGTSGTQV